MDVEEIRVDGTVLVEKRLSARERSEGAAVARIRSEATLLAALGGRVTPRLLDRGEDARGPWLRLEKIDDPTVAARLERAERAKRAERASTPDGATPLAPSWVEAATRAAFRALATLHEAEDAHGPLSVVHADLSSRNVAVDDTGSQVTILDFDLASWREAPALADGAFRGTVLYCAPEIARGEAPTVQSDLFAMAAVLLHAATGVVPRAGRYLPAVLAAAAERPLLEPEHAALAARGPGHAAILACLAHEPEARPRAAREVFERLLW